MTFVPSEQRQPGAGKSHVIDPQRRFVRGKQQRDLVFDGHLERILPHRRHPRADDGRHRRQLDAMLLHRPCSLGQRNGLERRLPGARTAHHARRGKSPTAVDQRSNTNAVGLAVVDATDLALPCGDRLAAVASDPDICVRRTGRARRVERLLREFERQRIGTRGGDRLCQHHIAHRTCRERCRRRGRRFDEVTSGRAQFFNSDVVPGGRGNSSTTIIIATS